MNAIEFAIQMELDGEEYYTRQATINKDNSLKKVCSMLANDEKAHARILLNKLNELPYDLPDTHTYSVTKNIFKETDNFKSEIKNIPSQLDFYRMALTKEQESINLYTDLLAEANSETEKELFEYFILQETQHFNILEELVRMLIRPEEWVESAEFGLREEY